jgi:anthranilate synthase/aminodeoxychorismate synthase-like glutamine amidotransferase
VLIIIDNYDSFTYNIVQTLATAPPSAPTGWQVPEMRVFRNDAITVDKLAALRPDRLLISPGPCTPAEAGISVAAIRRFAGEIPTLGVCLGHQSIGEAFGGRAAHARQDQPHPS